jgi:eukaryotic-like serine/threonine-protein kinase
MPAPATIAEFVEVVHKSGVLDGRRLDVFAQCVRAGGSLADSPRQLAEQLVRQGLLTRFQAEHLLQGKYLGYSLGHYRVLELVASGGMSAVYLCEHQQSRQRVAVKVLPRVQAQDPTLLKRFYREARACITLNHPNIVRGYEVGNERGQHFFAMEYVDGPSLSTVVKKRGPLPVPRACDYIRQAAMGLQHAHDAGLIHRDIKPSNLLLDGRRSVKILDLGLSRFDNDEASILTRDVVGTIEYLAPEQAHNSHLVDARADIYSLGGALYFLLAGTAPFASARTDPEQRRQAGLAPTGIRHVRPEVPEPLAEILERMMAEEPDQRPPSAAAVVDELKPWSSAPGLPPSDWELPSLSPAISGSTASDRRALVAPAVAEVRVSVPPRESRTSLRRWWMVGATVLLVVAMGIVLRWVL